MESPKGELSSWKEIAAYLGIGVRTAQIWEQERGLPVRRLPGGRGRVCATIVELEAWRHSAGEPPVTEDGGGVAEPVARRRKWLGLAVWIGASGFLLILVVAIAARAVPGSPVSFRVEHDTLIVLDSHGRQCWRKVFPYYLNEAVTLGMASRETWIGDLDGDGHNEVLFAPHPAEGTPEPRESTPLICYSEKGEERWRYTNRHRVRTSAEEFAPTFGISSFLATPVGKGGARAILVTTTHTIYYPCQVVLLDVRGRVIREYWHSGHLNFLQSADLDGDGTYEFYLAGINNARHAATVVALDMDHFGGAASEPASPAHQLLGFPVGVERARALLPPSCLNRAANPYNSVATFSVSANEILVQTVEDLSANRAGIFHHLRGDLREHHTVYSDSYTIEYRRARQEGRLRGCGSDTPPVQSIGPGGVVK